MSNNGSSELSDDDIVISGISGVFPEANNLDELKEKLFNNSEFIKINDGSLWEQDNLAVPRLVGRLPQHDKFDSSFFGIHSRQCDSLNEIIRNTLERSFEAIIDAGLNPENLRNTGMAVIMGSQISESESVWIFLSNVENGFGILGHNRAMVANRVSYWFNCSGPSYSFYSAETAGIEGLTLAHEAIKKGYCETALVGTITFALHPELSYNLKELGVLSEDGCNRSFDDKANGIVRSEASVVMFLQKAKNAKRIYASIVHSQFDCYGDRKSGYAVPLEYPLTTLLSSFYQRCGIDPSLISYLEADGSGIKTLDATELNAVSKILLHNRQSPLLIGSIKSNVGHTDAAAALVSVVKVLIAMETGRIPPNHNFNKPSQQVPALVEGKLKVVTETMPWSGGLAAVNAVGLTGVVGHILLRSHSKEKVNGGLPTDELPRLLFISGRTEECLEETFSKLESQPVDVECVRLFHDIYSSNIPNYNYRGYTILGTNRQYREIRHYDGLNRPIWFVFSGMGSQWPEMGSNLMKIPIISDSIQRSHSILQNKGLDLLDIITTSKKSIFDNILHSFVGITAIQIALVDFLKAINIIPDGYIGHSVGELGCAYIDGCLTAEETILAAYYRGLASKEADLIPGYMAAIGLGYTDLKDMCPPEIDIACHNSSNSCTISGPKEIVEHFVKELQEKKIFARAVNVANIAYHSRYIKPAAPKLLEYLKQLLTNPKVRSSKWISSSVPESEWDTPLAKYSSAEYHTNNLLNSVLFEEITKFIPNNAVVIEIAPHGLLQTIIKKSFGPDCIHISLTLRGHPNSTEFLLAAVGKIYTAGLLPKVSNLYSPVQYPVSRGTASLSSLVTWDHHSNWQTALDIDTRILGKLSSMVDQHTTISLNQEQFRIMEEHKIVGKVILPLSYILKNIWELYCCRQQKQFKETSVMFQDLRVYKNLEIPQKGALQLSTFIQRASGLFEVLLNGRILVLSGKIVSPENIKQKFCKNVIVSSSICNLTAHEVYNEFENRGYQYTDHFRNILNIQTGNEGCSATVKWTGNWCTFINALIQVVLFKDGESSQDIYLPRLITQVVIDPSVHTEQKDFEVVYQNTIGVVRGGGVEIQGLKLFNEEIIKNNEVVTKLQGVKFLPHINPRLTIVEHFLEVSLQIAFENASLLENQKAIVVEMDKGYPLGRFSPFVKTTLRNFQAYKADVKTLSGTNSRLILSPNSSIILLITPIFNLEECVSLLNKKSCFILARNFDKQTPKINHGLEVILEQQFESEKLLLFKKVVPILENASVISLTGEESSWHGQLLSCLNNGQGDCSRLYVVANIKPLEHGRKLIKQLSSEPKAYKLRYIFILDKNAPKFSLNKDFYRQQLIQDLLVNFYENGSWGSFRQLPIDELREFSPQNGLLPELRLEKIKINNVGLNLQDPSIEVGLKEMGLGELGHLELSGITDDGTRFMSVVQNKGDITEKSLDPYLTWEIPEPWSMEDAATVPLAYATAYHGMIQAAELSSTETVLIHAGHTSIGQAAIALALNKGSTVFTTVAESNHKEFLIKRFPQLQENNILSLKSNFDISLMRATKGVGVKVIVNCLRGSKLQSSLHCVAECGRFVQLGTADMEENTNIGMFMFLKNTTIFGIVLDSIFNASFAWRKEMHSAIQKGIKCGIVQPFERTIFTKQNILAALRELSNSNYVGKVVLTLEKEDNTNKNSLSNSEENTTSLVVDAKDSHLIIGTKFEHCLDLAEWLVARKASKITIASRSPRISALSERRLFLLHQYHGAHIVQSSADVLSTLTGAMSLIRSSLNLGPLKTIFVISLNDATSLHNLDVASRSLASLSHFVSLINSSADISESRFKAGLPILDVQWDNNKKLESIRPVIRSLDQLLGKNTPTYVYMYVQDELIKDAKEDSSFDELVNFLPSSIEELEGVGFHFMSKSKSPLVLASSLSTGIGHVPEVMPIFIIPGIQDCIKKHSDPLSKNLMYPTVYIELQDHMCLQDSSAIIVKQMRNIQPVGPYNLVGVSWGGILALELARELQSQDQKIQLFLLDGAPDTTQSIAKLLGTGDELQCNLITKLLGIESNKVHKELITLNNWQSRVDYALSEMPNISPRRKKYLASGLDVCYIRINKLLNYNPNDKLLSGNVHLIRPEGSLQEDNCELHKYFQGTVHIHLVDSDHRTIPYNKTTAKIINDQALVNISV